MRRAQQLLGFGALAAAFACAGAFGFACSGNEATLGLNEPVRVRNAQFIEGNLPGTPPGTSGPADLAITSILSTSRTVLPGQAGKKVDGRAGGRASAIGVRYPDNGSGYWVFPLGAPDLQYPGEGSWTADLEFALSESDRPGRRPLRFVAIDGQGNGGVQAELDTCFASRIPDNLHSCDPSIAPPDVVVTLLWDTDSDIDLVVSTSEGALLTPKHPGGSLDGGPPAPTAPVFSRDSLGSCIKDGRRQEDIVWQKRPSGNLDLYADVADACGKISTTFTMIVNEAEGDGPERHLVERQRTNGRLVLQPVSQATPTRQYVSSYQFE